MSSKCGILIKALDCDGYHSLVAKPAEQCGNSDFCFSLPCVLLGPHPNRASDRHMKCSQLIQDPIFQLTLFAPTGRPTMVTHGGENTDTTDMGGEGPIAIF